MGCFGGRLVRSQPQVHLVTSVALSTVGYEVSVSKSGATPNLIVSHWNMLLKWMIWEVPSIFENFQLILNHQIYSYSFPFISHWSIVVPGVPPTKFLEAKEPMARFHRLLVHWKDDSIHQNSLKFMKGSMTVPIKSMLHPWMFMHENPWDIHENPSWKAMNIPWRIHQQSIDTTWISHAFRLASEVMLRNLPNNYTRQMLSLGEEKPW